MGRTGETQGKKWQDRPYWPVSQHLPFPWPRHIVLSPSTGLHARRWAGVGEKPGTIGRASVLPALRRLEKAGQTLSLLYGKGCMAQGLVGLLNPSTIVYILKDFRNTKAFFLEFWIAEG
jgi:hypothetical protein